MTKLDSVRGSRHCCRLFRLTTAERRATLKPTTLKPTTAERRATLQIHPHKAASLVAGLLRLLDALQRLGQIALSDVTIKFN